jgi:hypothetical protein
VFRLLYILAIFRYRYELFRAYLLLLSLYTRLAVRVRLLADGFILLKYCSLGSGAPFLHVAELGSGLFAVVVSVPTRGG